MVFIKAFVEASLSKIPVYGDAYDFVNLVSGLMSGYTLLGDPVEDVWDAAELVLAVVAPFVGRPEAAWAIILLRRLAQNAKGLPRATLDGLRRLYLAGRNGQVAIEALPYHHLANDDADYELAFAKAASLVETACAGFTPPPG